MRIPYISDLIDARKESNAIHRERINLQKEYLKAKTEATKGIMAMTSIDRALSDELYGNAGSQYKIGTWALPIDKMRRMSRIAYWDSSFARSIIDRWVQIVVGKGLSLECQPVWAMIPGFLNKEAQVAKIDEIQSRFSVWAKSNKVHYNQEFNLDKISNLAFFYYLYDGEFFVIFRYTSDRSSSRNPLTIEFVAPENIAATTSEALPGNTIIDGIEYDARNMAVAYHVKSSRTGNSTRIPKFAQRSGRQLVYHAYNKKNEMQRRGVPLLAGEISEITQLADYQNLEIQAARVNALFAIWIEPPDDMDGRETIGAGARKKTVTATDPQTGDKYVSKVEQMGISEGGIIIDELPRGHKPHSFDTKRPNVNFDAFVTPVKRNIASGSGLALSLADYNYSQQYSSARGENIIQWYKVKEYQDHVVGAFLSVVYTMFLWGERDANKIDLPGFDDDETRDAWCNALWKGNSLPDIDPEKSMKANLMEMENGIRTRQAVAIMRDGGNVAENTSRLKVENDNLAEAKRLLMEVEKTTYSNSNTKTESTSVSTSITEGE